MWPKNALMVTPAGYDIKYSINPHMVDNLGALKTVNREKALGQWVLLKNTFERLGVQVDTLPGPDDLPDMVFCANQFFPFTKGNQRHLIMSRMRSPFRQPEVDYMREWATRHNMECFTLPEGLSFEGMGDALWNYETGEIFGGYGYRTDKEVYDHVESITGRRVHRLRLVDEHFYHLDTCLCILSGDSALYVHEAFSEEGVDLLRGRFKNLIRIPFSEALNVFAANACCVNGRDVVIQEGAKKTAAQLKAHGFKVHELDTSEYIKSGGSVFCMKMLF